MSILNLITIFVSLFLKVPSIEVRGAEYQNIVADCLSSGNDLYSVASPIAIEDNPVIVMTVDITRDLEWNYYREYYYDFMVSSSQCWSVAFGDDIIEFYVFDLNGESMATIRYSNSMSNFDPYNHWSAWINPGSSIEMRYQAGEIQSVEIPKIKIVLR